MRVFFNTLFHGDKTTKLLLWTCVGAVLMGIAGVVVFMFTLVFPWVIASVIAFLIPLVIVRKYDFSAKDGKKVENETSDEILKKTEKIRSEVPQEKGQELLSPAQTPEKNQEKRNEVKERPVEAALQGAEEKGETGEEKSQNIQQSEIHQQVRKETGKEIPQDDEETGQGEKKGKSESRERTEPHETGTELPDIDRRELKKLFFKYKVKREHKPVIIDSSRKWGVECCPAYMWVVKGSVHFLLMEENPRMIVTKPKDNIVYSVERGDSATEYAVLQNNALFMQLFGECLPVYHDEIVSRRHVSMKNLYTVADDIKLTNTSARAAFDLLKAGFELPDAYNLPASTGSYTKEAYKIKLLWQDGVITTNEYKNRIKNLLQGMTEANLSGREIDKNLEEMVSRQLITREYADYYTSI